MTSIAQAYEVRRDYEAFHEGSADENMTEEQARAWEDMLSSDPDLGYFTEVRRQRIEEEAVIEWNVRTLVTDKLDELIPVERVDVYMEERDLDARVRRSEFSERQQREKMELEKLKQNRKAFVAERIQGMFYQLFSKDDRKELIEEYAAQWRLELVAWQQATEAIK